MFSVSENLRQTQESTVSLKKAVSWAPSVRRAEDRGCSAFLLKNCWCEFWLQLFLRNIIIVYMWFIKTQALLARGRGVKGSISCTARSWRYSDIYSVSKELNQSFHPFLWLSLYDELYWSAVMWKWHFLLAGVTCGLRDPLLKSDFEAVTWQSFNYGFVHRSSVLVFCCAWLVGIQKFLVALSGHKVETSLFKSINQRILLMQDLMLNSQLGGNLME